MSEIDPKLSRAYREASSEEPPAALDAVILAAAKQRAATPRRPARASWVRWMAPASALATLLVGVSVAFLMQREHPEIIDDTTVRQPAPGPQRPQPERASETTKAKAADSAAEKKEAPAAAAPAPAATSAGQAPPQAPRPAQAAPPAAAALPAEGRAKAGAPAMTRESNAASDSASGELGAAAPAAAGKLAPLRQAATPRSPEAWLEEITRLKREGRDKEAAEQLAQFRKAYPTYALPEALLK